MNKEKLALALIIICVVGALVGLVGTFKSTPKTDKSISQTSQNGQFLKVLGTGDKIALIRLTGMIADVDSDGSPFGSSSAAAKARKYINKAAEDKTVKGVILRVNSPGGTVGASQEIYSALLRCRKNKPVVISMGDVAASGGYYVAAAGDCIVANPGTLTGSIGVILNAMNFTDLLDKIGVTSNVIKSGQFKDIGSPYRSMSEPERKLLQDLINNTYNQFVDDIIEGRIEMLQEKAKKSDKAPKLTATELRKIADGRIMTGEQAYEIGLIDELGDIEKAEEVARELARERFKGVSKNIPVQVYDKPTTISELLVEISMNLKPEADMGLNFPFSVKHPNTPLWVMEQ